MSGIYLIYGKQRAKSKPLFCKIDEEEYNGFSVG